MGTARVELRDNTVLKDYKDADHERYNKEIAAYTALSWATPKLLWHGEHWLEMERLTPILELPAATALKYRAPLRDLLQRVHQAGWWHGDCDLVNVVIHPTRGVLLVDWENACPSTGGISYDLYGARAAGIEPIWAGKGLDGVYWGSGSLTSPKNYWGS